MRKRTRTQSLSLCTGGIFLAAMAGARAANAQVAVTGNLSTTPVTYGPAGTVPGTSALATQTINTSFGKSTYGGTPPDATGSELDAVYGVVANGNLDLFLAGNIEANGTVAGTSSNHLVVFIADGAAGGQSTLNISNTGNWAALGMNGSQFSTGFKPNLLIDANDYQQNMYVDEYKLNATGSSNSYLGNVSLSSGIGHGTLGGIGFGLNNSNINGVAGDPNGTAASPSNVGQTVTTGLEMSIPMSALGSPTSIQVLAVVNGANDGFMSNQALPGLPVGTVSIGNTTPAPGPYSVAGAAGAFNFSSLANEYFSVPVGSTPNGNWLNPVSSQSWGMGVNWSNGYIPHLAGDAANFAAAAAASTVTLDGARTAGAMSFTASSGTALYTIAAGTGGTLTLDNGGATATVGVTNYDGGNAISAPVTLNSNALITVINSTDTFAISGNITGAGGLTANCPGNGVVLLSGTNSYAGATTIEEGNLRLGSSTALPTGTAMVIGGFDVPSGVLDLNGFNATVGSLSVITAVQTHGAVATILNTTTAAVTSTLTYAGSLANPSTFNGNINDNSGSGQGTTALVVSSGALTLGGKNAYGGGTTINNGATLTLSSVNATTMLPAGTSLPNNGNVVDNGALIVNDTLDGASSGTGFNHIAGNISGSGSLTINASMTLTGATVNLSGAVVNNGILTITGGGTLGGPVSGSGTLNANGTTGTTLNLTGSNSFTGGLNVNSGTVVANHGVLIGAPAVLTNQALPANGTVALVGGTLQLAPSTGLTTVAALLMQGGTFDITNNHLIINYGSPANDPITQIQTALLTGYAGGLWNGTGGIVTSAPLVVGGLTYGIGYADSADAGNPANLASGTLEVKYTLLGDADLSGIVNGIDFGILAANFNKGVTGWDKGDFDYNNIVNGIDFGLLAANFNKGAGGASVGGPAWTDPALMAFATANGLLADVPEPASMGLVAAGAVGLLARRRRR